MMKWVLAATLICGASVFTACSNNDDSVTEKGQLLEVYDVQGSAIFIHVKGSKPYTGGCISFDEDRMVEILKNCDMSLVIKVME